MREGGRLTWSLEWISEEGCRQQVGKTQIEPQDVSKLRLVFSSTDFFQGLQAVACVYRLIKQFLAADRIQLENQAPKWQTIAPHEEHLHAH